MPKNNFHPEYQYLDLLKEILKDGVWNVDRGTGVRSKSVFGRQTRYDLSKGFPLLTTKKVYWKGVLHELYWFMSGDSNIKYLVDNNVHIWDDYPYKIYVKAHEMRNTRHEKSIVIPSKAGIQKKQPGPRIKSGMTESMTKEEFIQRIANDAEFAKKWGELPRIYGEMWRRWPTKHGKPIDQLQWVIDELREDSYARNAIVTSWNPEYLYTMARYEDASRFPICHNMYQVSIKDGKLYLQLYQRSADMFLGVPFNIASYALLTIILAQILKVKPGEFVHTFGDAHIYENHIDQVKEQLKRKPKSFPEVKIDKSVKEIKDFKPDKVELLNYDPHPGLKGELTVAGGLFEGKKK